MFFYSQNTKKNCTFKTKDKILESGLTLFSSQGYFNTSVQDIQKHSGVSIGSIYNYFEGKDKIAEELRIKIFEQMCDAFQDIVSQYDNFEDKYLHIVKLMFEMTETESRTMNFIFHSKPSEYIDEIEYLYQSNAFGVIFKQIDASCSSDLINSDKHSKEFILASLFSLPIQMIQLRLDGAITTPLTQSIDTIFNTVWKGVCRK